MKDENTKNPVHNASPARQPSSIGGGHSDAGGNQNISPQGEESDKIQQNQRDPASLVNEMGEYKQKCEEYLNNWKRSAADFINYKKEEIERMAFLGKYVKEDIILKILPILDSIYLSEKHSDILQNVRISDADENSQIIEWVKGFTQIKMQIAEFLKKEGIEEIKTVGEKFNPETMEAVEEIANENIEHRIQDTGIVVEELQKGYIIDGKVIRPSKVRISK